jgi:hypothetical protein
VVFVPSYNPTVVYGAWMYPAYPPIYVPPPPGYWWSATVGGAIATGIAWGIGNSIGNAMWGGFDWGRRDVNINVNRYNYVNVNRRLDVNTTKTRWSHDTKHRGSVPYRGGEVTRQQLSRKAESVKRDHYRGRAETAMRTKGIDVDRAASRDFAKPAARDLSRDRKSDPARPATGDGGRDRAAALARDGKRDLPQTGKRNVGQDRADMARDAKQRDQVQRRDREQARAELSRAGRDNALKGADSPKAKPQIDRGNRAQQSMKQRPVAKPMVKAQARPQAKPMARPQARPKPMAKPQGGARARAKR